MAKSQVKGSKKAKKKPPFQHGNGGSIIEFTHQCRWRLCRDSRTKRNSGAQCGTQKCRSEPCQPTPTQQSKALSSLFQFVAVCSSLSYLHLVSKIDEIPWGQIWVTVFRVVRGNSAGHGGSRQTASSNQWHMDVKVVLLLTPQGFSQLRVEARSAGALVSMSFHEGKSRESVGAPLVPLGFRAAMRAQGTQRKQLSNRRNCLLLHAAAISVFCLCSAFKES